MDVAFPSGLRNRVMVVTGAARGIGRAIVDGLLPSGAKIVATDRSWDGTDPPSGGDVLVATMDVTRDDQIDAALAATIARFGTVDGLVNNAAMRQRELYPPTGRITTLETSGPDWERAFAVNLFGVLKVTRRFIMPMLAQERGRIVNIASSGILTRAEGSAYVALRPNSREMPYQSTKAALATMSFYLADEVRPQGVAVNIVIPGYTRTTGFDVQARARREAGAPPAPLPLLPAHVVPLVGHLLAADGTAITGRMFDAMVWNAEQGLGGEDRWRDPGSRANN